jgi:hypothetical protein
MNFPYYNNEISFPHLILLLPSLNTLFYQLYMDELFTSSDEETNQKQVTQEWGTKKANFYEEQEQLSVLTSTGSHRPRR